MKKKLFLFPLFISLIIFLAACGNIKPIDIGRNIEFNRSLQNAEVSFSKDIDKDAFFKIPLPVYKIVKFTDDKSFVYTLLLKYGMSDAVKSNNGMDIIYKLGEKTLTVGERSIIYDTGVESYEELYDDPYTLSVIINEIAENMDIIPNDFILQGVASIPRESIKDEGKTNYLYRAEYRREIDGCFVNGRSDIYVYYGSKGFAGVEYFYSSYDPQKKSEVKTISEKKLLKYFKDDDAVVLCEDTFNGDITSIYISEMEIIYFDPSYDAASTHIQPWFRLKGSLSDGKTTKDFVIITKAVS